MFSSLVYQFSTDRCSSCGYCKQKSSSRSHGMIAHMLSVNDYQDLIDRGWRRSGTYCYKPIMAETCCPSYTIRCDAENIKLSKSQKKILNKFNKFLNHEQPQDSIEDDCANESPSKSQSNLPKLAKNEMKKDTSSTDINEGNEESRTGTKKGIGADPNRAPCKKAKLIRLEKKQAKIKSKDTAKVESGSIKSQNYEKQFEDYLTELPEDIRNRLQIKLVRTAPPSNEWKATETVSHQLYQRYQMVIHGDSAQKCNKAQFEHFLVTSPLKAETRNSVDFGSFHQQYWLDGNLIAVGVIDILPKCVSSVYFFYDPSYGNLSLGTYGAIREIGFTRQLQQKCADIKYYYMGFYIHSCPKMRYKGNYSPSYLLCPETFEWFPLKDCVGKLDREKYARLNPNLDAIDTNEFKENQVNELVVFYPPTSICLDYSRLKSMVSRYELQDDMCEVNMIQYGKLIGKECSRRIVMYFT
ncbi:arginyltransferase 1 isoform X3 [Arctopsyche grandis]|uniref:arginyltransferase 1 isoform X3 n=1 Tax=Arctopsyche grandis TaxID=121162 RepID=UPI00406D7CF1